MFHVKQARLADEIWFAARLKRHGVVLFDGLSTVEQRRDLARQAITEHNLTDVVIGKREGQRETYGQCFERLYGASRNGNS